MDGLFPIKEMYNSFMNGSGVQFSQFEKCKTLICTNPLMDRMTKNWQAVLLDCSTVIAVGSLVAALFAGSMIFSAAFAVIAVASGVGSFYMRQFLVLSDLEKTAQELKASKERFEKIANDLETENGRLSETNRELQQTNETFRTTNRELQTTNEALRETNTRLTNQVTQLTLQVTQLRESAERIKQEMVRFQQQNSLLNNNVEGFNLSLRVLDQQILASRALCEQITNHLTSQQQGLGEQLTQLRDYLSELRAENRVHERIQELAALHGQLQQATTQLQDVQLQYAAERANFQAIHEALVQLKDQFDAAIRGAVSDMQSNNQQLRNNMTVNQQQFQENINALSAERQRIQQILNRYNGPPSAPPQQH